MNTDVVVRIARVPEERWLCGAAGRGKPDGVSAIGRLFGVSLDVVRDRRIRADAHGLRFDGVPRLDLHRAFFSALDLGDVRAAEDVSAHQLDGSRKTGEILERVELSLLRKTQSGPSVESRARRALDETH